MEQERASFCTQSQLRKPRGRNCQSHGGAGGRARADDSAGCVNVVTHSQFQIIFRPMFHAAQHFFLAVSQFPRIGYYLFGKPWEGVRVSSANTRAFEIGTIICHSVTQCYCWCPLGLSIVQGGVICSKRLSQHCPKSHQAALIAIATGLICKRGAEKLEICRH